MRWNAPNLFSLRAGRFLLYACVCILIKFLHLTFSHFRISLFTTLSALCFSTVDSFQRAVSGFHIAECIFFFRVCPLLSPVCRVYVYTVAPELLCFVSFSETWKRRWARFSFLFPSEKMAAILKRTGHTLIGRRAACRLIVAHSV